MPTLLLGPPAILDDLTRRELVTGAISLGALAACGSPTSQDAAGNSEARWRFTDDRGITVDLPARPARIAAYEIAGGPLRFLTAPVVAVFGGTAMGKSSHFRGLDLAGISSAGEVYGEVNFEKLKVLRVDLIVTLFNADQGALFGLEDGTAQALAEQIAPIVAFDGAAGVRPTMDRFFELAGLVGADVAAPALTAARERYGDAREALRAATAGKPGLRAVAIEANPGVGAGFLGPCEFYPQLRQFAELGLDLAELAGGYEEASLEELDRHPADLLLVNGYSDLNALAEVPTWAALPAIKAGQTVRFEPLTSYRYDQQATELEAVAAAAVRAADPDLV